MREEAQTLGTEHGSTWTRLLWGAASARAGVFRSDEHRRLLSDGSPAELEAYAQSLIASGLTDAGELALARAAQNYESNGERGSARAAWLRVAIGQAERFGPRLGEASTALDGLLDTDGRWRVAALKAAAHWPEEGLDALDPLREAVRSSGSVEPIWAALLAEALVVGGRHDEAIQATSATREGLTGETLDDGRLRLELDVLDAIEERDGAEAADESWNAFCSLVNHSSDPAALALSWQRRAAILLRREALDETAQALLRAAGAWETSSRFGGEVSEAWFAWRAALELSGGGHSIDRDELATAATIRHDKQADTEAASQHEAAGLRARTVEQFADARVRLWQAFVLRRRRGHLFDLVRILRELGHVHEQAGEPAAAISLFVGCGAERQAERTARATPGAEMVRGLKLDGPPWERAAAYAALGARGREAPEDFVLRWGERVLSEAEEPWFSIVSPQPAMRARNALAVLFCALPDRLRQRALRQLRKDAASGFVGTSREAARALGMSTSLGWSDETPVLVNALLHEGQAFIGVPLATLAEHLGRHPDLRSAVRVRALDGHRDALELLVGAGVDEDDEPLRARCTEVAQGVGPTTIRRSEREVSVGMASFESAGIIGREAEPAARTALAANLAAIAGADEEPLMNRVSAVNALFNLAPAVDRRADPRPLIERLAQGDVEGSPWDDPDAAHPFARVHSTVDGGELHAAALSLLGRWKQLGRGDAARLAELVLAGLLTQHAGVVAAALDALARAPALKARVPAAPLADHAEARVRAALATLMAAPGRFDPYVAEQLAQDTEAGVRSRLLDLEPVDSERCSVLARLADDPDAYVRARARQLLSGP